MYYAGAALILFIPSSCAPLSSVKSNEQMLLSCWSRHDRRRRWQAHPSAEGKWEGSSGQRTECRGGSTCPCFSPFSLPRLWHSLVSPPRAPPTSTLPPAILSIWAPCQPFCSTDHLPVMCPCPQVEEPAGEKGQNVYDKVSGASERWGPRGLRGSGGGKDVMEWRSLNIFSYWEIRVNGWIQRDIPLSFWFSTVWYRFVEHEPVSPDASPSLSLLQLLHIQTHGFIFSCWHESAELSKHCVQKSSVNQFLWFKAGIAVFLSLVICTLGTHAEEDVHVARINSAMGPLFFNFSFVHSLQEGFSTPYWSYTLISINLCCEIFNLLKKRE